MVTADSRNNEDNKRQKASSQNSSSTSSSSSLPISDAAPQNAMDDSSILSNQKPNRVLEITNETQSSNSPCPTAAKKGKQKAKNNDLKMQE
jgi:hypothetical protein